MGRAIVREPAAFLMDEPLSNLDAKLRVQMRAEISRLQRDLGVTTIYVTHDQIEAMTMGDRVAVMRKGELQQVDDPQTLYDRPVNLFVGGFIGSPGDEHARGDRRAAERRRRPRPRSATRSSQLDAADIAGAARARGLRRAAGDPRHPARRTSRMRALVEDAPPGRRLTGRVELREALGSELMVHFALPEANAAETRGDAGARRRRRRRPGGHRARPGRSSSAASALARASQEGEHVEAVVDTRALHFFDPETGLGIYDATPTKGAAS